jgi:TonB family protein
VSLAPGGTVMGPVAAPPRDRRLAAGLSLALHLALLALLGRALLAPAPPAMVVFSVETVSGVTPHGEGSGAQGTAHQMSDKPANLNPLAGGLRLSVTDAPLPQAPAKKPPAKLRSSKAALPTLGDLDQRYQGLRIGVQPRDYRPSMDLSEGGMGNAHYAGTETGPLALQGAIAGRGYRIGDYSYGKPLPEESEVLVQVAVSPQGVVLSAVVKKTSGYPELDQHALAKAREIVFDPLPPDVQQQDVSGTVPFEFDYNGKMR